GVLLDEEQLDAKSGWYLVALAEEGTHAGLAYLDVSTGEFAACELAAAELDDELARLGPRELLLFPGEHAAVRARTRAPITEVARADSGGASPGGDMDRALLAEALGAPLDEIDPAFAGGRFALAVRAAAACVRYARATQPAGALPL